MKRRRKKTTKKRRKKNQNSRDPKLGFFLERVRAEVLIQEENDAEALAQANRFYSHRNLTHGNGNIVGDISEEITELPTLKHVHMQEFAFRYAMENRPLAFWGEEFGVSRKTITNYLKRPDVNRYIIVLRRNHFLRIAAMRTRIDLAAMDELYEMIRWPTTDDNYAVKSKLLMAVLTFDPRTANNLPQMISARRPMLESKREELRPVGASSVSDVIPDKSEVDDIESAIAIVKAQ